MKRAHVLAAADRRRIACVRCDARALMCEYARVGYYYYCGDCWHEPGPAAPSPAERTGVAAVLRVVR